MFGRTKTVVLTAKMLDAGYLMLDIMEFTASGIRYPESGIQDLAISTMTFITTAKFNKMFIQLKGKKAMVLFKIRLYH
jgi:membrane protein CcdC involved in cytochrome C biogenesis